MNGLKVGSPVSRRGGASVAASFFSDSAMRSCTRSATQKHTCAMSGLVIVDSMYSDDVELYRRSGGGVSEEEDEASAIGESERRCACSAAIPLSSRLRMPPCMFIASRSAGVRTRSCGMVVQSAASNAGSSRERSSSERNSGSDFARAASEGEEMPP